MELNIISNQDISIEVEPDEIFEINISNNRYFYLVADTFWGIQEAMFFLYRSDAYLSKNDKENEKILLAIFEDNELERIESKNSLIPIEEQNILIELDEKINFQRHNSLYLYLDEIIKDAYWDTKQKKLYLLTNQSIFIYELKKNNLKHFGTKTRNELPLNFSLLKKMKIHKIDSPTILFYSDKSNGYFKVKARNPQFKLKNNLFLVNANKSHYYRKDYKRLPLLLLTPVTLVLDTLTIPVYVVLYTIESVTKVKILEPIEEKYKQFIK
ncbi:MAG: hypothetical protein SFU98_02075 [Leptospiraceae bacterium]|nr:hypothetical protein [Leptospiraceae bacterium]